MKIPVPEEVFEKGIGIRSQQEAAMLWLWSYGEVETGRAIIECYIIPQTISSKKEYIYFSPQMVKIGSSYSDMTMSYMIRENPESGYIFTKPERFRLYGPDRYYSELWVHHDADVDRVPIIELTPKEDKDMTEDDVKRIVLETIRPKIKIVRRFYRPDKGNHFYTESRAEAAGIKFGKLKGTTPLGDLVPLNQIYNDELDKFAVLDLNILAEDDPRLTLKVEDYTG